MARILAVWKLAQNATAMIMSLKAVRCGMGKPPSLSAKRDGDDYVLNGSKCWIGNASIADVKVVWAKDDDDVVGGFIVEKDAPGFRAQDIEGKFSLRMSRTSECWFDNCRIPAGNRLPKASGLRAPLSGLFAGEVGRGGGGGRT